MPCLATPNHFSNIAKSYLHALLHTACVELLEDFPGFSSTRRARSGSMLWHCPPWFPSQWLEGTATPKLSVTSVRYNLCSRAPCVLRPSGEMGPPSCYSSSCSASLFSGLSCWTFISKIRTEKLLHGSRMRCHSNFLLPLTATSEASPARFFKKNLSKWIWSKGMSLYKTPKEHRFNFIPALTGKFHALLSLLKQFLKKVAVSVRLRISNGAGWSFGYIGGRNKYR